MEYPAYETKRWLYTSLLYDNYVHFLLTEIALYIANIIILHGIVLFGNATMYIINKSFIIDRSQQIARF